MATSVPSAGASSRLASAGVEAASAPVVSWWVVDAAVPAWLASDWSLEDVRFGV